MVRSEGLLFSLVFLIPHLSGSEHQTNGANHQLADGFQSFIKTRYKSWLQVLDGINSKKHTAGDNELTALDAVTKQKKTNNLVLTSPTIEGSIVPTKALRIPYFLRFGKIAQENRQASSFTCTCEPSPTCSTTCTSLEVRCGRTCTHSTIFAVECGCDGGRHQGASLSTSLSVRSDGCATLNAGCLATVGGVGAVVGAVVAAAAAVAVAVAVAVPVGLQLSEVDQSETEQFEPQFLDIGLIVGQPTPANNLEFPVNGNDFPDDGCGDNSVRFSDGNCYPVLRRGPCTDPHQWVTLDPVTIQARCSPRLCGRQRVFVGQNGLCHDINDPFECNGGRRLYYTAYGDPLCDCPIGQYPFPNVQDDCISLFSKGPCPDGNVVAITPEGRLGCMPKECQSIDGQDNSLQLVSTGNGVCYPLGSRGPCTNTSQLLGYDVFKRQLQCVNILDPSSPYFSSPEEEDLIDSVYNQFIPEYDDYQISLIYQNVVERKDKGQRRQGGNTAGAFQFPSSSPDALLQPCRNGAREGINFKCTNPLVSNSNARPVQQAVSSAFRCPANRNLQATGQCASDNRGASCGPSFQFNSNTGQCRSVFRR